MLVAEVVEPMLKTVTVMNMEAIVVLMVFRVDRERNQERGEGVAGKFLGFLGY